MTQTCPRGGLGRRIEKLVEPFHGTDSGCGPCKFQVSSILLSSLSSMSVFVKRMTSMKASGKGQSVSSGTKSFWRALLW